MITLTILIMTIIAGNILEIWTCETSVTVATMRNCDQTTYSIIVAGMIFNCCIYILPSKALIIIKYGST